MTVGLDEDELVNGESIPPGAVDLCRLIDTYPWWRRPIAWLAWHTPVVKTVMRWVFGVNPYRRIVAKVDAVSAMRRRNHEGKAGNHRTGRIGQDDDTPDYPRGVGDIGRQGECERYTSGLRAQHYAKSRPASQGYERRRR